MTIQENIPLSQHSTMRLGGTARYLCTVTSEQELLQAIYFADKQNLALRMIGEGSNIIWGDKGFDGLIIVNRMETIDIKGVWMTIGAGFLWDEAVKHSIAAGLSGIEFLSLIPGTTGATPVQNVGAYGVEIKDVFVKLRAFDLQESKFVTLRTEECGFNYRTSRFKTSDSGRFLITQVVLKLHKNPPQPPFYPSLQKYLDEHDVHEYTAKNIREAVVAVRSAKLPDPATIANNGSFFANPIVSHEQFGQLQTSYPDIVGWNMKPDGMKVSAAWLIEKAGLKGVHDDTTGIAIWEHQPLVLVNEHAKTTADLLNFRDQLTARIQEQFGVMLQQEPELIEYSLDG